ncbi:MAG: ABC transporter ATP-binding protein [Aliiglaciecola sp.]|uniref:ABC transporter ATP-binding protein n=1 Tax=Aliiglaciecola sp. TaxID=1872441 RepID=UPI00329A6274
MSFLSLFKLLRYHKTALSLAVLLMLAESLISLSIPYFIGQFSMSILDQENAFGWSIGQICLAWVALIILQAVLRFESTFRTNIVGAHVLNDLSCRLYDHVQMLPMAYFSNRKKGEILSLISNDANVLSYFLSGVLTGLVPAALIVLGAVIMMANINLSIALIIVITVPVFLITIKIVGKTIRPISEQVIKHQAGAIAIATENFGSMQLVKAFNRQSIESKKFRKNANQVLDLRTRLLRIQALISPLIQMIISIGIVFIVVVSALHYQSGELTIPNLITLLMYGLVFAKPMSTFAGLYGQLQQARGSSTRILEVFNVSPESDDKAEFDLDCQKGSIEFNDVSFAYQADSPILTGVDARFENGSASIILGPNGAGKTSLIHLLMRFMEPQTGNILIDQQAIADCSLVSLRKAIGLVSQDIALCDGNILDNIAYGLPQASEEEIIEAAKLAGADSFITDLKAGYYTKVGENGVLLSGGQRQRISLARALVINPQILLFDEPTSFTDDAGKQEFSKLLAQSLKDKTIIIVTHDQQLCEVADKVYKLEQGKLALI